MALENAVVEDQVHDTVSAADEDALLAGFKAETVPEFEQESLQPVEQRLLDIGFAQHLVRLEPEELEDIRVANGQARFGLLRSGLD